MENKKKVLFVSAANSTHTVKWVNSLADTFEVHLAYCKNHKPNMDKIDSRVILHSLCYNAPFGYYLNCLQLKKISKMVESDIINIHYASGYGTLARISKLKNFLLSVWGSDVYDFPNQSKLKKRILKKNVMYASEIASTSNIMAKQLKKQIPDLSKQIYITPFGVDINQFKKNKKNKPNDDIIIGNVKTLNNEVYGIDIAILAIKKLKENLILQGNKELSDRIKLYGDGEDKEKLIRLINSNHLEETVFLKGKIAHEKVPEAINEFDIFCITSNKESFGVSVIEAMACEVPVVATDADGFQEVIENNCTGIIVKRKNIDEIAKALEKLINNENLREQMGKNGRKKVMKEFDWENNVRTMVQIYKKCINRSKDNK